MQHELPGPLVSLVWGVSVGLLLAAAVVTELVDAHYRYVAGLLGMSGMLLFVICTGVRLAQGGQRRAR